ncbi:MULTISPECIES: hypothetical protein [Saccharothrix]|uniref:hypothetical protein n=1 Tax=Saccharothrix TaxID=2071 RepID=UPI0013011F93|nr:hypothetical protein [Saccharothrix sp. CB00851]
MDVRRLEVLFPGYVDAREYAIAWAVWSALNPAKPACGDAVPGEGINDAVFGEDVQDRS